MLVVDFLFFCLMPWNILVIAILWVRKYSFLEIKCAVLKSETLGAHSRYLCVYTDYREREGRCATTQGTPMDIRGQMCHRSQERNHGKPELAWGFALRKSKGPWRDKTHIGSENATWHGTVSSFLWNPGIPWGALVVTWLDTYGRVWTGTRRDSTLGISIMPQTSAVLQDQGE